MTERSHPLAIGPWAAIPDRPVRVGRRPPRGRNRGFPWCSCLIVIAVKRGYGEGGSNCGLNVARRTRPHQHLRLARPALPYRMEPGRSGSTGRGMSPGMSAGRRTWPTGSRCHQGRPVPAGVPPGGTDLRVDSGRPPSSSGGGDGASGIMPRFQRAAPIRVRRPPPPASREYCSAAG